MQYKITLTDTGKKKVYVNPGVREGIYLYPGEIKKLRLEDGSELEQDEFERIRLEYALPRAKHRAIAILAKRDKTEQELREKLLQSLTDTQSLEEAISYMKACGYVDDTQYARDYLYFKKGRKSDFPARQKVYAHFARKGYAGDLIREAIDKIEELEE